MALGIFHIDVEGILHRPRRMVLPGLFNAVKLIPVGPRSPGRRRRQSPSSRRSASIRSSVRDTGCRPPLPAGAPGQGDVERLGLQLRLQLGLGRVASRRALQRRFDALLDAIDFRAAKSSSPRSGPSAARPLSSSVTPTGLAEVARLRVLEVGRRGAPRRSLPRRPAATDRDRSCWPSDRAGASLTANGDRKKKRPARGGDGLVGKLLPRGSLSLALIAASQQSRPRRDHVQAS